MKLFKTLAVIYLTLFSLTFAFAQQDFQGQAIYQTKTTVDMSSWGGGQMSEQRKKQIADRMKNMLQKKKNSMRQVLVEVDGEE